MPIRQLLCVMTLLLLACGCAPRQTLRPFTSDGCSLFPDRALVGPATWCSCCLQHDLAYWRGGSSEQRLQADQELRQCVLRETGNEALADSMYAGVRAGGTPHLPTWYRWAYGWPQSRNYEPLTAGEQARADQLQREYFANARDRCSR